jgi:hypothetical protein
MNGLLTTQLFDEMLIQRHARIEKSFRAHRLGRRFGRKAHANPNVVGATDGQILPFRPPDGSSSRHEHASARVA